MVLMDTGTQGKSIGFYRPDPVSEDDVKYIIQAAMSAISAGNKKPWQFIMIRERSRLDAIMRFQPHSYMMCEAPMAILLCGDRNLEMNQGFLTHTCSAAMGNMLLAAAARNLSGIWLGIYPIEERVTAMSQFMGLPEHVVPFSLMVLGHPVEDDPIMGRYDPARVHDGHW